MAKRNSTRKEIGKVTQITVFAVSILLLAATVAIGQTGSVYYTYDDIQQLGRVGTAHHKS